MTRRLGTCVLAMTRGPVVVHNTGDRFKVEGAVSRKDKVAPDAIAALLRSQR